MKMDSAPERSDLTERFFRQIFAYEVLSQAKLCMDAAAALDQAVRSVGAERNVDNVYRHAHSLLTHAANVSKLICRESPEGNPKRVSMLQDLLAVPAASLEILARRKLRNHLEHFDQRIDEWVASNQALQIVDRNVGPLRVVQAIFGPQAVWRHYDSEQRTFTVRGETFDLVELLKAVSVVHGCAENALASLDEKAG